MLYQVLLCSVNPGSLSQQQAEVQTTAVCDQYWLLKITAIAPEASQQAQAAHAIGKHTMLLATQAPLASAASWTLRASLCSAVQAICHRHTAGVALLTTCPYIDAGALSMQLQWVDFRKG